MSNKESARRYRAKCKRNGFKPKSYTGAKKKQRNKERWEGYMAPASTINKLKAEKKEQARKIQELKKEIQKEHTR